MRFIDKKYNPNGNKWNECRMQNMDQLYQLLQLGFELINGSKKKDKTFDSIESWIDEVKDNMKKFKLFKIPDKKGMTDEEKKKLKYTDEEIN